MQQGRGLEHFHKRKRAKNRLGKKLTKPKRVMDNLIYVVVVLGPLLTIPQVYQIFSSQDASGVSVISWGAYSIGACFWLGYGVLHREKPIILTNIFLIMTNLLVLIGALMYG